MNIAPSAFYSFRSDLAEIPLMLLHPGYLSEISLRKDCRGFKETEKSPGPHSHQCQEFPMYLWQESSGCLLGASDVSKWNAVSLNLWKPWIFLNKSFAGPPSTLKAVNPHGIIDNFWNWPVLMAILEGPLILDYWIIAHWVSILSQDLPLHAGLDNGAITPPEVTLRWLHCREFEAMTII